MGSPVILVHGAFCGGWAFDRFRAPLEAAGHSCLALDLPGREGSAAGLSMADFAAAVTDEVEASSAPPILIGHSLGGLVVQMAAARAPVAGVILLAPAAPWGIAAGSMEEAAIAFGLMSLAPFAGVIEPNRDLFAACSLDRADPIDRRAILDRMRPESGRALSETFNWWLDPFMTTAAPRAAIRAPVLALAGEKDVVCPPASVRQTAARLGAGLTVMPGMSHWLIGEPGWERVAGLCLAWMDETGRAAA